MENNNWENRITWSGELITGNDKIDEQHKKIITVANVFIEACLKKECNQLLSEMLSFLIDYTVEHFDYEEKLMIEYNFSEYENHKNFHEEFKITVNKLKTDFDSKSESYELSKNLSDIIVKWLIKHIKHEDLKIAKHIRKTKRKI